MRTSSTRPLKPWNVRAFLIGLGASVVLAWIPLSVTHDTSGIVVFSILGVVAVIALAPLPSRRRSPLQVLSDAGSLCAGLFAPSVLVSLQAIQSADSHSWFLVFAAIPIALTLGALLFARVFVWCQRPRRLV